MFFSWVLVVTSVTIYAGKIVSPSSSPYKYMNHPSNKPWSSRSPSTLPKYLRPEITKGQKKDVQIDYLDKNPIQSSESRNKEYVQIPFLRENHHSPIHTEHVWSSSHKETHLRSPNKETDKETKPDDDQEQIIHDDEYRNNPVKILMKNGYQFHDQIKMVNGQGKSALPEIMQPVVKGTKKKKRLIYRCNYLSLAIDRQYLHL